MLSKWVSLVGREDIHLELEKISTSSFTILLGDLLLYLKGRDLNLHFIKKKKVHFMLYITFYTHFC